MKKLFVLAVASLIATSASAAEMKWNGSAGWRYSQTKYDDSLGSKVAAGATAGKDTSIQKNKAWNLRANLGVTGGWENMEWGVGMRTTSARNDDWTPVQNGLDRTFGLEQAWFRYIKDFGSVNVGVTFGRQKNAFAYDMGAQSLFDNDVRWDGFGWNFKFGMFGLNAAQYITGAKSAQTTGTATNGSSSYTKTEATDAVAANQSHFNTMMGIQPTMTWKFSDEIEALFAVGYYFWNDDSNQNLTGGGNANTALNTGAPAVVTPLNFNVHNPRQWQFLANFTLPYHLGFTGELVMNAKKKANYDVGTINNGTVATNYSLTAQKQAVGRTAYALGLTYGQLKKAHDFMASYTYAKKGIASVIGNYSNETFKPDNKGHIVTVGYNLADNFTLGFAMIMMKEIEKKVPTTGLAYSGASANQSQKTKYWELTSGVSF